MLEVAGLAEGTETIAVFIVMCLLPAWFGAIAYAYAALCVVLAGVFSAFIVSRRIAQLNLVGVLKTRD